jgi:dGTPase
MRRAEVGNVMNRFYSDFDKETLVARRQKPGEHRTPFQIDRDRVIFSSAFRRMQRKTQVFQSGEYDFYRTRLTHSLEVAQIGRGICLHLLHRGDPLSPDFLIDPDLVEASCLSHDIGHPPFGHAGERALNDVMHEHGGFEGNAQTLRILTDLIFGESGGMQPTRAFLDGVLKYKRVFDGALTPAHFIYPEQERILEFVFGRKDWRNFCEDVPNAFRSIECQIMDWADDVAYGLMDIVDAVAADFITIDRLLNWANSADLSPFEIGELRRLRRWLIKGNVTPKFAQMVGDCINATSLRRRDNFMAGVSNRYSFDLIVDHRVRDRIRFYKRLAIERIFRTPQVKQLEFKGRHIITKLFNALSTNYSDPGARFSLAPPHVERCLSPDRTPRERARVLCDYVAGMTDAFAIRTYRRLFDPEFGSVRDL